MSECGTLFDPLQLGRGDFALPHNVGLVVPRTSMRTLLTVGAIAEVEDGTESPEIVFRSPARGIITELVLGAEGVSDQALARASLKLKLTLPLHTESVARGENGAAFVSFQAWYDGDRPVPFYRVVDKDDRLVFQVRNDHASTHFVPLIEMRFIPIG